MMSDKDSPPPYPGEPTATTQSSTGGDDEGEMKHVWKFVYIDMSYAKSIPGLIQAAELVISLLCIISVSVPKHAGCAQLYGSTYSYIEFTSSSCLISCIIWYCLYLLAVTKKIGFVRWDITHLIWCVFYVFNYFIGSCVLAAHSCGQGGYKAGTAFGFICLIVLLVDGFLTFRGVYERYKSGRSSTTTQQQQPAQAEEAKY